MIVITDPLPPLSASVAAEVMEQILVTARDGWTMLRIGRCAPLSRLLVVVELHDGRVRRYAVATEERVREIETGDAPISLLRPIDHPYIGSIVAGAIVEGMQWPAATP